MALNPVKGDIIVDATNRTVTVQQRQPLAIHPDTVVLTFDVIKTLAANIMLMELGAAPMVGGSPPGSGGGEGKGPAGGGEGRPLSSVS
jgi:hypothetical protein